MHCMNILSKTCFLFLGLTWCYSYSVDAQNTSDTRSTSAEKKAKFVVLPAVYFSPETSLGFGAVVMYYFRNGKDSTSRPSNVQNIFIYTLENQILCTNPYNIFFKREAYWLRGELDYFLYPYQFYGIGSTIDLDNYEAYTANFMRLDASLLRKVEKDFYLGPSVFYDHYFDIDTKRGGVLETEKLPGSSPGNLFAYGVFVNLDKRNNVFSPFSGYYLEARLLNYEKKLLGNYHFLDVYMDARAYFQPADRWETAFQLYHQTIIHEPPFYNYAMLGGSARMRGYYRGAYRDQHQTNIQTEVRRYISKKIIASAFGGLGAVSSNFGEYNKLLGSYGVGLRYELDSKEHVRIRLDYAMGNKTSGIYININEAF